MTLNCYFMPCLEMLKFRSSKKQVEHHGQPKIAKARRRDELMNAIQEATPAILSPAAERLSEAMRKKDPSQRRRRWDPPASK